MHTPHNTADQYTYTTYLSTRAHDTTLYAFNSDRYTTTTQQQQHWTQSCHPQSTQHISTNPPPFVQSTILLKQRQPHFFGWERCCGEPQHYFSHSLIIRSSSIYSVSQLFFALILTQIWLQIFQIPLVRSLCDSVYLVRSLCDSVYLVRILCAVRWCHHCVHCVVRDCSLCLSWSSLFPLCAFFILPSSFFFLFFSSFLYSRCSRFAYFAI